MKLYTSLTAMVAAASASTIFSQPQPDHFAEALDKYQSAVEYQQPGIFSGQAQALAAHELAYQRPLAEKTAKILAYHSENNGVNYHYGYDTENGIRAEEIGRAIKGTDAEGAYSYTGDNGVVYTVTYTAGPNGFIAKGAHLPTPPPTPEAILKALEENSKDEANGIFDDGQYHEQQSQQYHDGSAAYQVGSAAYNDGSAAYQVGSANYQDGSAAYNTGSANYNGQAQIHSGAQIIGGAQGLSGAQIINGAQDHSGAQILSSAQGQSDAQTHGGDFGHSIIQSHSVTQSHSVVHGHSGEQGHSGAQIATETGYQY